MFTNNRARLAMGGLSVCSLFTVDQLADDSWRPSSRVLGIWKDLKYTSIVR